MKLHHNIFSLIFFMIILQVNAQKEEKIEKTLISVQEIMDYAFSSSQVVMMNEAHSGQKRNIRTRVIGQVVLPKAHAKGVRFLAMEALTDSFANEANSTRKLPEGNPDSGYLHQPEMRNLMQLALDLGWNLVAYEADISQRPKSKNSIERSNWREKEQANNLAEFLKKLNTETKILIWCGNSHHSKEPGSTPVGDLYPMGYQFWQITGIEPFVIDQIETVDFTGDNSRFEKWIHYQEQLRASFYGTMGFINLDNKSAQIISIHNKLD